MPKYINKITRIIKKANFVLPLYKYRIEVLKNSE